MRFVVLPAAASLVFLAACDQPPMDWSDPVGIEQPASSSRLVLDAGTPRFIADTVSGAAFPPTVEHCAPVVVTSGLRKSAAAWWSVRPDSSSVLFVSASADSGRTWETPLPVDTTDVSSTGCRRPPPALATVGDDVYVAYSMAAPEGTGVFFAHTMSGMVHSPVPVIYGERLVATAIAADARHVVVAYEQPNGSRRQVDVAISASQGHLFETHTPASRSVDKATQPIVALDDSTLAISWLTRAAPDSQATRVVRVGRIAGWN